MHARGTAAARAEDTGTATGGGASTSTVVDAGRPVSDAGASAGPGTGSESEGGTASAGTAPCAAASTAPGVTPKEIHVGSISTVSGPVPGLAESAVAATRAYVAYRNSVGGVCGRKVVLSDADDGAEGGRYRSIVQEMARTELGLVGGFSIGDVGGIDVVRAAQLPVVTTPSDDAGTALPTLFDINPPFDRPDAVIGKYRYIYEQGVRTVAAVYLAVAQSRAEAQRQERLMEAAGIRVVQVQELPLSTLSYDAAARKVANARPDYLFFIGDVNGNASMARSMRDTGYRPKVTEYLTFSYGSSFVRLAGDAAEGATTWLRSLPYEEAPSNPELATMVRWMDRIAPGVQRDTFAPDAWASAKVFFDSLQALPGPITRAALVAHLGSVGTYDAGGMFGPIRFGRERTDGCVVGMRVAAGKWERLAPATGFLC